MNALASIARELYGLFVEDLAFAIAIAVWIALFAVFGHGVDGPLRGALLFAGFALILLIGARRASRR